MALKPIYIGFLRYMLSTKDFISYFSSDFDDIFIAYSGGVDSHVLLHLLSLDAAIRAKITAVYVHHGLQQEADAWAIHCKKTALDLGVTFKCLRVNAQKIARQSQEEVARNARYSTLKTLVKPKDVLLLAQHREDQLETVLLQLFRGAGVQGLSGMPVTCVFGKGKMYRPFLDVAKQAINDYAQYHHLQWVEDKSNQCDDFDRNFLRNQIVPQLKQKWPALDKTVSRSARHCAASQSLTDDIVTALFKQLYDNKDGTLKIALLLEQDMHKQQLLIRMWFKCKQLRMPSEVIVHRIIDEVAGANIDANPLVAGRDYCVRRYRNKLFCLPHTHSMIECVETEWEDRGKAHEKYQLTRVHSSKGIPKVVWDNATVLIKFRAGQEKIRLPYRTGHHSLKKLFQEKAIPPWQRPSIPLIYLNNRLAAVADLWISADFFCEDEQECYQIEWKRE